MGRPPPPLVANGWMSTFENKIKGNDKLYARYMDDILCNIKKTEIDEKLMEINS